MGKDLGLLRASPQGGRLQPGPCGRPRGACFLQSREGAGPLRSQRQARHVRAAAQGEGSPPLLAAGQGVQGRSQKSPIRPMPTLTQSFPKAQNAVPRAGPCLHMQTVRPVPPSHRPAICQILPHSSQAIKPCSWLCQGCHFSSCAHPSLKTKPAPARAFGARIADGNPIFPRLMSHASQLWMCKCARAGERRSRPSAAIERKRKSTVPILTGHCVSSRRFEKTFSSEFYHKHTVGDLSLSETLYTSEGEVESEQMHCSPYVKPSLLIRSHHFSRVIRPQPNCIVSLRSRVSSLTLLSGPKSSKAQLARNARIFFIYLLLKQKSGVCLLRAQESGSGSFTSGRIMRAVDPELLTAVLFFLGGEDLHLLVSS